MHDKHDGGTCGANGTPGTSMSRMVLKSTFRIYLIVIGHVSTERASARARARERERERERKEEREGEGGNDERAGRNHRVLIRTLIFQCRREAENTLQQRTENRSLERPEDTRRRSVLHQRCTPPAV